jgi:hypothetical protein
MGETFMDVPTSLTEHMRAKFAEQLRDVATIAATGDLDGTERAIAAAVDWFSDFVGHLVILVDDR